MEYRKLPRGGENERFSAIGLGLGGIHDSSDDEIEKVIREAITRGINYFDLYASEKHVFAPVGRAIAGRRESVFLQTHLGAVYNKQGAYEWSRDYKVIKDTYESVLSELGTDYADMGFLHCVDTDQDFNELVSSGVFGYLKELKAKGIVRHIGFSSHTPSVAEKILDTGAVDMFMLSVNPAYDYERGDELGVGTNSERAALYRRCEAEGIGISVMKVFFAGKLLDEKESPFGKALTKTQCIQYALDRPGVLTVLPGVRNLKDLEELWPVIEAPEAEKDYSVIGSFTAAYAGSGCVYCNHCQPCPAGINVGLVNKYYDLALAGDRMADSHYGKLTIKADDCVQCGHCDRRCPFHVAQSERMITIANYFKGQSPA